MSEEEHCKCLYQLNCFGLTSLLPENALKCLLEFTAHYQSFKEIEMLACHHFNQFQQDCKLLEEDLLLILFGLEGVAMLYCILEEAEITEDVEV